MTTNCRIVQILPIFDKIIAYLRNQSKKFQKISRKKILILQLPVSKKVQNFMFFGKIFAYLQN